MVPGREQGACQHSGACRDGLSRGAHLCHHGAMRYTLVALTLAGCMPSFPMAGAPRPRYGRAVLVPMASSGGCNAACASEHYAYCTVVTFDGKALVGADGRPRQGGVVCFYDR